MPRKYYPYQTLNHPHQNPIETNSDNYVKATNISETDLRYNTDPETGDQKLIGSTPSREGTKHENPIPPLLKTWIDRNIPIPQIRTWTLITLWTPQITKKTIKESQAPIITPIISPIQPNPTRTEKSSVGQKEIPTQIQAQKSVTIKPTEAIYLIMVPAIKVSAPTSKYLMIRKQSSQTPNNTSSPHPLLDTKIYPK